jgi:hypothetical protein
MLAVDADELSGGVQDSLVFLLRLKLVSNRKGNCD